MADYSEHPIIAKAVSEIDALSARIAKLKGFVNQACELAGLPPHYADTGPDSDALALTAVGRAAKWRPDEFFNKPFTGAVRRILEARKEATGRNEPARVEEIHEALLSGGYSFESTNADAQKHSIRTSLGKNTLTFVRLPNSDLFGLTDWYGGPKTRKGLARKQEDNGEQGEGEQAEIGAQEASTNGGETEAAADKKAAAA